MVLFFCLSLFAADLRNAVEMDDLKSVRRAIESGAATVDQKVVAPPYSDPTPIIGLAARAGSVRVAGYLISNGALLDAPTPAGETPLMLAVYYDDGMFGGGGSFAKQDAIAKSLVDAGADLENGDFWPPLAYAAYKGRVASGSLLIGAGARLDGPLVGGVSPVNTPLMMAAMNGQKAFLRLLLRAGANAGLVNHQGATALSLAKKYRHTHLVGYLECALRLRDGERFADVCD